MTGAYHCRGKAIDPDPAMSGTELFSPQESSGVDAGYSSADEMLIPPFHAERRTGCFFPEKLERENIDEGQDAPAGNAANPFWLAARRWSMPVGRPFGIEVRVHALAVVGIGLTVWDTNTSRCALLRAVTLCAGLFLTFLVHELGHALTARLVGRKVDGIVLAPPLLGAAFIDMSEEHPFRNMLICLSGPLANLCVAFVLFPFRRGVFDDSLGAHMLIMRLIELNLLLGIINMIPLYPLDGGRILRDILLLLRMRERRANILTLAVASACFVVIGAAELASGWYVDLSFLVILFTISAVCLTDSDGEKPKPGKAMEEQSEG